MAYDARLALHLLLVVAHQHAMIARKYEGSLQECSSAVYANRQHAGAFDMLSACSVDDIT